MPETCSIRLREQKETILSIWQARCIKEVTSAGTSATLALRNSLPMYLDHLAESLKENKKMDFRSVFARDAEGSRIGRLHGADRASNRSYDLSEVIFEYHILRESIFEVLERKCALAKEQRDIILDSIEQAVNDAAVEFSEIHTEIQQKFVNTLTHDLKSPITAAKLGAQIILRRTDIPDGCISVASRIVDSLNRIDSMIHDLLDASRVRAGEGLSLQFIRCDLSAVIREVVDEMAMGHDNRFKLNIENDVVGTWGCDGLRRAVDNLVGNAVKYGSPNTPISVSLAKTKTGVEISVHNEGNPIPELEVPGLFEPFRRSKSAQEGSKTGWGLGLTLVKGVVDAHKGSVRVESSEGKGTTFYLDIPHHEAAEATPE